MNITALEEYGIRCALQLAQAFEQGSVAASRIAEAEGISLEYVSKLMHVFRKAGLVVAVRGAQGGFRLVRSPSSITVLDVFQALESGRRPQSNKSEHCAQFKGQHSECVHFGNCSVRPVWETLFAYFENVLKDLTLAHLLNHESHSRARVEKLASAHAHHLSHALGGPL